MRALVELIELYRPGFAATVQGATEDAIEDLEDLMGPLPGAYRRFLQTMGAAMGDFSAMGADFDMEACRSIVLVKPWICDERYLYIAYDGALSGWDFYMDRDAPSGADDCMVVRMPLSWREDPTRRRPVFSGLEELLYVEAYWNIRLPLFAHRSELMRPITGEAMHGCEAAAVCAEIEALGFVRVPPASPSALYERRDAALALYQVPDAPGFSLVLGCDEAHELRRLEGLLRRTTGVVPAVLNP